MRSRRTASRLDEQRFPGRQGRILFAYLAAQEGRPVPRDELAELLWGDALPATWEKALRVLMTKLRAVLEECGIDGSTALTSAFGCYRLSLPEALDRRRRGGPRRSSAPRPSWPWATPSSRAPRRRPPPRSPGAASSRARTGTWVEERRRDLRELLVRALECQRDAAIQAGDLTEAVRYGDEVTELEPYRESAYRALMQAHAAAGNPAEALRVYDRCRRFLSDELGAYPSPETEALYQVVLQDDRRPRPPRTASGARAHPSSRRVSPHAPPPRRRGGRRRLILAAATMLLAVGAVWQILGGGDKAAP